MNGAELLVKTAVASGVEVCFANPGTTEIPIVMALDSIPGIRSILGLFEGVCTGAADGYGRMLDKPAMTSRQVGRAQRDRRACDVAPGLRSSACHGYRRPRQDRLRMVADEQVGSGPLHGYR